MIPCNQQQTRKYEIFPQNVRYGQETVQIFLTVLVKYNPLCDSQFRKNE